MSCLYQLIEKPGADCLLLITVWRTLIQLAFISYTKHGSYKISSLIRTELNRTLNSQESFKKQLLTKLSNEHELKKFYEEYLKKEKNRT